MRISDWSSDVCSSDLLPIEAGSGRLELFLVGHDRARILALGVHVAVDQLDDRDRRGVGGANAGLDDAGIAAVAVRVAFGRHVEQLLPLRVIGSTPCRDRECTDVYV